SAAGLESCPTINRMIRTRSWNTRQPGLAAESPHSTSRALGIFWLAGASFLVAAGLAFVYAAKTQNFPDVSERLRHADLLNLNAVSSAEQLAPFLDIIQDRSEREADAEKLFAFLRAAHPLRNVGTLARLRQQRKPLLPVSKLKSLLVVRSEEHT